MKKNEYFAHLMQVKKSFWIHAQKKCTKIVCCKWMSFSYFANQVVAWTEVSLHFQPESLSKIIKVELQSRIFHQNFYSTFCQCNGKINVDASSDDLLCGLYFSIILSKVHSRISLLQLHLAASKGKVFSSPRSIVLIFSQSPTGEQILEASWWDYLLERRERKGDSADMIRVIEKLDATAVSKGMHLVIPWLVFSRCLPVNGNDAFSYS